MVSKCLHDHDAVNVNKISRVEMEAASENHLKRALTLPRWSYVDMLEVVGIIIIPFQLIWEEDVDLICLRSVPPSANHLSPLTGHSEKTVS